MDSLRKHYQESGLERKIGDYVYIAQAALLVSVEAKNNIIDHKVPAHISEFADVIRENGYFLGDSIALEAVRYASKNRARTTAQQVAEWASLYDILNNMDKLTLEGYDRLEQYCLRISRAILERLAKYPVSRKEIEPNVSVWRRNKR